jgi:C1A family cysteine protease
MPTLCFIQMTLKRRRKDMPTKRGYGYVQDEKDELDYKYSALRPVKVAVPPSVDLRAQCSPVRDQGQLGSCTGFAIAAGLREFMEIKQGGTFTPMSPLFLYYEERKREHTIKQDAGAQPRDGMKVLTKMGCAPEADDPYDVSKFTKTPPAKAVSDAKSFKISAYHRLMNLDEMKTCLADGMGFMIGFKVYESFESDAVAQTGKMPMPGPNESAVGGHAVFVAGYAADPTWPGGGYLIIKNSWGTSWGDQGYFYMPWDYVQPSLVMDAWTATI